MAKPTCVFLALVFALDLSAALQIPFIVLPNSNPQITSLIPSPATWIPQPTLYSGGTPLPSHTPDPLPMPKPEMPIRKSSWALSRIAPGAQPIQWMFPNPPGAEKWGEGVLVYVVDSGVNPMDPELEGAKIDPQGEGIVPALIGRMNPNIKTAKADSLGHGTAVASLIVGKRLGLAPAATIIPVRIVDNDGQESKSTTSEAILGVQAARKHFQEQLKKDNKLKAIINISWRLRHTGTSTDRLAENEIEQAILAGMHVIMSVGNDGGELCYIDNKVDNNIQYYKTRIKDVGQMFIGGTSWLDERSPSSNWGSCVTLWAPGKDIEIPAFPGGTGATQWVEGTSFATPLVSGVAAAILSQSLVDLSPFQLISILQKAATPGVIKGNLGRGNNNLLLSLPAWLLERGGALSGYFRRAL